MLNGMEIILSYALLLLVFHKVEFWDPSYYSVYKCPSLVETGSVDLYADDTFASVEECSPEGLQ